MSLRFPPVIPKGDFVAPRDLADHQSMFISQICQRYRPLLRGSATQRDWRNKKTHSKRMARSLGATKSPFGMTEGRTHQARRRYGSGARQTVQMPSLLPTQPNF